MAAVLPAAKEKASQPPAGLLAWLAEKPHPGPQPNEPKLHWADHTAKLHIALGFSTSLYDSGIRSCCSSKERDAETGLDWFTTRYFSGAQGRFTSPDRPLVDQSPDDPQSWNLYSYVRNNPLSNIDPTGQDCVYTNDFSSSGTVGVERGQCTQKGGQYYEGTIDTKSFNYNSTNGQLGFSYTNGDVIGSATIGGLAAPPSDPLPPGVGSMLHDAGTRASRDTSTFMISSAVFAGGFASTYAGPALWTALTATGGEAGVLRLGSKTFDEIIRDATGRVHGELPKIIPKNVTREQLQLAAQELRASIQARMQNMVQLGNQGNHGIRLSEEQQLLYRIEQRLGQR